MKKFQYSNEGYSPIIPEEIRSIIKHQFGLLDEDISSDYTWDNMGIDSLDIVELTMEVEKVYEISISDLEIEKCYTLGDFVKLVEMTRNVRNTLNKYKR